MKVLILAEQCNPEWPSLPGFSYSLAEALSGEVDVTLVTHIRNKANIEKRSHNFVETIFIDNEAIASPLDKASKWLRKHGVGGWMTNMALRYPAYISFEKKIYKLLKSRFDNKEFDIIHRISPVSPTLPSPLASMTNIPFIFGPINGSLPWPNEYKEEIKKEREIVIHVRNLYKLLPYYKSTYCEAARLLAAFNHVKKDIPEESWNKIVNFNELGVDTELYKPSLKEFKKGQKLKFLFVGRLVPYKGAHVAIRAFASSKYLRENHELIIVGDGPEQAFLTSLIDENNLSHCVQMVGWKNQQEVAEYMGVADVFVFPTIREVGGNVVIEAMSSGLPTIVPNYGGPSELVTDNTGYRIPLANKDVFLDSYIAAMEQIANDPALRQKMSTEARDLVVKIYSWPEKAKKLLEIYRNINKQYYG